MILSADRGLHIDSHDVLDATPGAPGGVCHLMRTAIGADTTFHERFITLGGLDGPTVTWTATSADRCPSLTGNGVWSCTRCTGRRPGAYMDAQQHVTECLRGWGE
ncbi:hypothetical protein AB0J43_01380 [Nonomuraea fuscirosea]